MRYRYPHPNDLYPPAPAPRQARARRLRQWKRRGALVWQVAAFTAAGLALLRMLTEPYDEMTQWMIYAALMLGMASRLWALSREVRRW